MVRIQPTITVENPEVAAYPAPTIDVSGIPATVDVGDTINPQVNVKYLGSNVQGVVVDFFAQDSLGIESLGRDTTDLDGNASAIRIYYVSEAEESNILNFIIVTRSKKL